MKLPKRQPTGREKDEAAVELLERLREKLYVDNSSVARRAAFSLSWMQEDGLEILEEALFSSAPSRTKSAACYGLRRMHGRMKKKARETIEKGLKSTNSATRKACENALDLINKQKKDKGKPGKKHKKGKVRIKEMRNKKKRHPVSHTSPLSGRSNQGRNKPRR